MKLAVLALVAVFTCGWLTVSPVRAGEGAVLSPPVEKAPSEAAPSYADPTELATRICTRAAATFRGFFDPSLVHVHPFVYISAITNDSSVFGVMLADQMAAVLNGHANAVPGNGGGQRLEGVMQAVDGYLRIHMLGTNGRGQRRSHVALVEMSAPLYRALHTYAEPWPEQAGAHPEKSDD